MAHTFTDGVAMSREPGDVPHSNRPRKFKDQTGHFVKVGLWSITQRCKVRHSAKKADQPSVIMSAFSRAMFDQLERPERNVTFHLSIGGGYGIDCPCRDFLHVRPEEQDLIR